MASKYSLSTCGIHGYILLIALIFSADEVLFSFETFEDFIITSDLVLCNGLIETFFQFSDWCDSLYSTSVKQVVNLRAFTFEKGRTL